MRLFPPHLEPDICAVLLNEARSREKSIHMLCDAVKVPVVSRIDVIGMDILDIELYFSLLGS